MLNTITEEVVKEGKSDLSLHHEKQEVQDLQT